MKVVINRCFGGFGLSEAAIRRYCELKGLTIYPEAGRFGMTTYWLVPEDERVQPLPEPWIGNPLEERVEFNRLYSEQRIYDRDLPRDDATLVQVVEELGSAANGRHANLAVVEIPDDVKWGIHEYDGLEHVEEAHRTWGEDA